MPEVVELSDAMAPTADDAVILVPPSSTLGSPDAVLAAIGARFYAEGGLQDITSLYPIAAVYGDGFKGLVQPAKHVSLEVPSESLFNGRTLLPEVRIASQACNIGTAE